LLCRPHGFLQEALAVIIMINKQRIDSLASSTKAFVHAIEAEIQACPELEKSVHLTEWLARFLTRNYCGIYEISRCENKLAERFEPQEVRKKTRDKNILHIASEVYIHGGHTRLLKHLLYAHASLKPLVAMTRSADVKKVSEVLSIDESSIFIFDSKSEVSRINSIANFAKEFNYIALHIHPDDVATTIAIKLAKKANPELKVFFINHSDHTFSVAIRQATQVLELSSYGWSLAKARGIEGNHTYLGIPIQPHQPERTPKQNQRLAITAASSYKFKPNHLFDLQKNIGYILKKDLSLNILAIGPRFFDYWWWLLKIRYPSRVKLVRRLAYPSYMEKIASCDLYIDSYPITGGTAFTEALLNGCLVMGLTGGPYGFGVADYLRAKTEAEFVDRALKLLNKDTVETAKQVQLREQSKDHHAIPVVSERFNAILNYGNFHTPPLSEVDITRYFDFETEWRKINKITPVSFRNIHQTCILKLLLKLSRLNIKNWINFNASLMLRYLIIKIKKEYKNCYD
jgi:hypothetical protein